jgi:pyridinium-3,5-bisthiocarboxylic acid mononucleotide nickel chelatase
MRAVLLIKAAFRRESTTLLNFVRAPGPDFRGINKGGDLQLHLELAGGLTGDMFVAAVLDAFPQFEDRVTASIDAVEAACPVVCSFEVHADHDRLGHRFDVEPFTKYFGNIPFAFAVISQGDCAPHEPSNFRSVRDRLSAASIDQSVRAHSENLFRLLADAEAAAHGIEADSIEFREIGAWDAIADIVGAATLIDALGTARWTASPVLIPQAMTPTGAAILRYLCPSGGCAAPKQYPLVGSGTGFPSRSPCYNHVRVLCFDERAVSLPARTLAAAQTPRMRAKRASN